jgi:hypothetical protein
MKSLNFPALAAALALLAGPVAGAARDELERHGEDNEAVKAVALYPEPVRDAILEAAAHPELFVKLARIQRQSSAAFAGLLEPYARKDREALWDLARFPSLIEELADGGPRSKEQIREVLEDYPEEIRAAALQYGRQEYELLVEIAELNRRTEREFDELIDPYPPAVQESLRLLLRHPEALSALSEDLDLVILLGDAYQQDPDRVRQRLAELHLEAARKHAEGLRDRSEKYEEREVKRAARSRAARYDYDLDRLDDPEDDPEVNIIYHGYWGYYDYPYPYWFGYPRWYGPAGWSAYLNWWLTPHVSAGLGIEVPVVSAYVPVYRPYRYRFTGWAHYKSRPHWRGHHRH